MLHTDTCLHAYIKIELSRHVYFVSVDANGSSSLAAFILRDEVSGANHLAAVSFTVYGFLEGQCIENTYLWLLQLCYLKWTLFQVLQDIPCCSTNRVDSRDTTANKVC